MDEEKKEEPETRTARLTGFGRSKGHRAGQVDLSSCRFHIDADRREIVAECSAELLAQAAQVAPNKITFLLADPEEERKPGKSCHC